MNEPTNDFCAAYGCPMFGVHGENGKWYCCCHFNVSPSHNDSITLELNRQKPLVDQILAARREGRANGKLEAELLEITRPLATQPPVTPVTGPTYAEPHFSETGE